MEINTPTDIENVPDASQEYQDEAIKAQSLILGSFGEKAARTRFETVQRAKIGKKWFLLAVLTLLTGTGVVLWLSQSWKQNEITTNEEDVVVADDLATDYEQAVREVVKKIARILKNEAQATDWNGQLARAEVEVVECGGGPYYQPEGLVIQVPLNRGFCVDVDFMDNEKLISKAIDGEYAEMVGDYLVENGFTVLEDMMTYVNKDQGVVCNVASGYRDGLGYVCSHADWYDVDGAAFPNQVALESGLSGWYLATNPTRILDSKYAPYQTLDAGMI